MLTIVRVFGLKYRQGDFRDMLLFVTVLGTAKPLDLGTRKPLFLTVLGTAKPPVLGTRKPLKHSLESRACLDGSQCLTTGMYVIVR